MKKILALLAMALMTMELNSGEPSTGWYMATPDTLAWPFFSPAFQLALSPSRWNCSLMTEPKVDLPRLL